MLLLDNPSKLLVWNATGKISAKLVQLQNSQPLASQNLELYFKQEKEGNWTLFSKDTTDEAGTATFSFPVNLTNGKHDYMVAFDGQHPYLPASNESYVVVVGDPISPTVSITCLEATDHSICFDYTVNIDLSSLNSPTGGLTDIYIVVTAYNNLLFLRIDGLYLAHYDLTYGQRSYVGHFYTEELQTLLGPVQVGWFKDLYDCLEVKIKADAEYSYTAYPWWDFLHWFPYTVTETSSGYNIRDTAFVDDDPNPPQQGPCSSDYYKMMGESSPYRITIQYSDPKGWTGVIQYYFANDTYKSETFGVPVIEIPIIGNIVGTILGNIIGYIVGSTDEPYPVSMNYYIPKQGDGGWGRYPGTTLYFRTRAIDHDFDGLRIWDVGFTDWTGWIPAGGIYCDVGGRIANVAANASFCDQVWEQCSLDPNAAPDFRDMYLDDNNAITMVFVNPTHESVCIYDAVLSFTSYPEFSVYPDDRAISVGIVDSSSSVTKAVSVRFTAENFYSFDAASRADIFMCLSFKYYRDQNPSEVFEVSSVCHMGIVRPPAPSVEFVGFVGSKEGDEFVLKTGTGGATVEAQFRVTNYARIPIRVDQELFFSPYESEAVKNTISLPTNPCKVTVYAHSPTIVSFPLTFNPVFFKNEQTLISLIVTGVISEIPTGVIELLKYFEKGSLKLEKWVGAAWSVFLNAVAVIYDSILLLLAESSRQPSRDYLPFHVESTWQFEYCGGVMSPASRAELAHTSVLEASASSTQQLQYTCGVALRLVAVGLYSFATVACACPLTVVAGTIASLAGAAADIAACILWQLADDDVPTSTDYTSIYVPEYFAVDTSNFKPTTELESAALSLLNSCSRLVGDLMAANETESRKAGAIAAGDYQAALMQNEALINCTRMITEDYRNVGNELSVVSTLIAQDSSEIVNGVKAVESSASSGITAEDILLLQNAGFNQTEITTFNQTVIDLGAAGSLSNNLPATIAGMLDAVTSSIPLVNAETERLENDTNGLIQESIGIKVNVLHESVTTADNETLTALRELEVMMLGLYGAGDWNGAISSASQLLDLAQKTARVTNNETYLLTFGKDAQDTVENAREFLQISLEHLPKLEVTLGEPASLTLIVRSEGAPTGNYVFETNSSWIGQNGTVVLLTQYDYAVLQLPIFIEKNPLITQGNYPVNFRVYLPQTGTIVNSILILKVKHPIDTSPPTTTINLAGTKGVGDWYISNLTISLTRADDFSGVAATAYRINGSAWTTYTQEFVLGVEGIYIIEYNSTDNAGNIEQTHLAIVRIDKTPPQTTIDLSGTEGAAGWYKSDVKVTLDATDPIPGSVAMTEYRIDGSNWMNYSSPFDITTEGHTTIYYRSVDMAGNNETEHSRNIWIDKSPPTTTHSLEGTRGLNDWFVGPVTITLSAEDGVSGVYYTEYSLDNGPWTTCREPLTIGKEGAATLCYRSLDNAGNLESFGAISFKIDMTPPTTTSTVEGEQGLRDWYKSDVTVTLSATDNISGFASRWYSYDNISWNEYLGPLTISYRDITTVYYRSTDNAGNTAKPGSVQVKIYLAAQAAIGPQTLNLKSKGQWVTVYIQLPQGYTPTETEISSFQLRFGDNSINASWGEVQDGLLMVKFDRAALINLLSGLQRDTLVQLEIWGKISGQMFAGTVTVRVI